MTHHSLHEIQGGSAHQRLVGSAGGFALSERLSKSACGFPMACKPTPMVASRLVVLSNSHRRRAISACSAMSLPTSVPAGLPVVTPQSGVRRGSDRRRHRWQGGHRRPIHDQPLSEDRARDGMAAQVGLPGQPVTELGVEVRRRSELSTRQKRGPQIAVRAFHRALVSGS